MIAIEPRQRLFYEGASNYGHAVWPSPVVSVATLIMGRDDASNVPDSQDIATANLIFREDSFDPVTRIRRGRFYCRSEGSQPHEWHVQEHPAFRENESGRDHRGYYSKQLYGFNVWSAQQHPKSMGREVYVVLGVAHAMTLWRIVGVEQISTGEYLITLKARSNYGVLPELLEKEVPGGSLSRVSECLDKLIDAANRSGPESVVDRCRDACVAILGAWLEPSHPNAPKMELSKLSKLAGGNEQKVVLESAGKIVARLHARAKPNEQANYGARLLVEADAELSIECVGVIMREVGWAH